MHPADPNWMTIAGLLYWTAGAFMLGKAIAATGTLSTSPGSRHLNPHQYRFDVMMGLALIGVGTFLQIVSQFGGAGAHGVVVILLLALIAVLMMLAFADGLVGPRAAAQPAVKRDLPQQRVIPAPVLVAAAEPKMAAQNTIPMPPKTPVPLSRT